jgi:hypothetical protein
MNTNFIHVESSQMSQVVRLASEAVVCSSLLTIKGPQGSGKTHAARMLARRWQNREQGERDESKIFPWRVIVFHCNACSDPRTRMEMLIRAVHPQQKVSGHRIPHFIEALASALRRGDPLLLYVDNAHLLDKGERANLLEAVQMARENHPVGLVMSTLENQVAFERILDDPRSLAEVRLLPLKAPEVLCSMQHYDPRFEAWYLAYKDKDREAQDLAKVLAEHTRGSFARLVSLRDSLAFHADGDVLTTADIQRVIALRTP